jgi:hypothetical protein
MDEYFCKKGVRPDELTNLLFDMKNKYESLTGGSVVFGFEKAKHEKIMKWMLGKEMQKRNEYLILKDIKWDKDKITRIITRLQPRYSNHTLFHRTNYGEYENQLLRLPEGVHDDLPDAAQIVETLLRYPKKKRKEIEYDGHFEWLMKQERKKVEKRPFVFGQKGNAGQFPFKTSKSYH